MFSISEQQLPCDALYSRISSNHARPLVGFGGRDASIHVYPFMGFARTAWLQGFTEPVTALAFDPDQTSIVGGSDGGKLQMWDLSSEEVVRVFGRGHASTVTDVDAFQSGPFFATVSTDKNFRIWDSRKQSSRQSYKDATAPLCAVKFSPNGRWVATGCARGVVRLYDLRAGKLMHKFELHSGAITSLHFHPDVYYLAVGSGDGTVSMLDMDTFSTLFHSGSQHTPIDAVRFCGRRLLTTSDHNVRIFDMAHPSDRTAASLEAPWMMMSDVAYASAPDEAWFVETSGSTALRCKLPLRDVQSPAGATPSRAAAAASPVSASTPTSPPRRVPVATLNSNSPIFADARKKPTSNGSSQIVDVPAKEPENRGVVVQKSPPPASPARPPWERTGISFPATQATLAGAGGSELLMLEQVTREHGAVSATLQRRLSTLRIVRTLWQQNQPEALTHVKRLYEDGQEFGPLFDLLTVLQQHRMKEKMLTESIAGVVELAEIALRTDYEPLIVLALRLLRSIAAKFRARVEEVQRRARSSQSTGYNDPLGMSQHPRITERLRGCAPLVEALAERRDRVGDEARAVLPEMPASPKPPTPPPVQQQ